MKKNDFRALPHFIPKANTMSDLLRWFDLADNGRNRKTLKDIIEKNKFDISHFKYVPKNKYERIKKICPVCEGEFEALKNHPRDEKTTCSYSCSNTYFRSGENNGFWREDDELVGKRNYVKICFRHHEKKCIMCGEKKIVGVHHYDENRKNNNPENLIPMCPTHHQYYHSRYKNLVEKKIDKYRNNFIKNMKS